MKTTNSMIIKMATLCAFGLTMACQQTTNTNVASPPANRVAVNGVQPESKTSANANQTEIVKTETVAPSTNGSLATPTDAYKTAYAARKKKDVKELKKTLSKDMLEFFTMMGEADKKTIDDALMQLSEKPQAPTDESRNEKIDGNTATLEYSDEQGNWKTMDFIKEGSDWKLTFPKGKSPMTKDMNKNK